MKIYAFVGIWLQKKSQSARVGLAVRRAG